LDWVTAKMAETKSNVEKKRAELGTTISEMKAIQTQIRTKHEEIDKARSYIDAEEAKFNVKQRNILSCRADVEAELTALKRWERIRAAMEKGHQDN
jgi:flagellar biosynthesis chaperone FliJ